MGKALVIFLLLVVGYHYIKADPVELDLADPPCEWAGVLHALASNTPVKSAFEELRTNPFHKRPRRFKGNIFWHPDFGLSLQYTSPGELKINISSKHVILYRKDDPPRRMDVDTDNPALGMFFKLFDWDMAWLGENFTIAGELDDSGWELQLRSKDDRARSKLSRIDLEGVDDLLKSIRLDFPAGREVRIKLSEQEYPWVPDVDLLKSQFEIPNDQK